MRSHIGIPTTFNATAMPLAYEAILPSYTSPASPLPSLLVIEISLGFIVDRYGSAM
jgi:hypothetical protein